MKKQIVVLLALAISGCASESKLLADLTKQKPNIQRATCRQVIDAYERGEDIEPYVRAASRLWVKRQEVEYGSAITMSRHQAMDRHYMRQVVVECMEQPERAFIATYVVLSE